MAILPLNPGAVALQAGAQAVKREVRFGWKEGVMLATVIACVVNAVQAFFLNWMWMGGTFLLAAGTLTLSSYYVHYFNDGIALENTVEGLKQENEKMKQINQTFLQKTEQLEKEAASLEGTKQHLQGAIGALEDDLDTLHVANRQLENQAIAMKGTVETLSLEKKALQAHVEELNPLVDTLKTQTQTAGEQNQALRQELDEMQQHLLSLQQEKRNWEHSMQEMREKLAAGNLTLSNTVDTTEQHAKQMLGAWQQEAQGLDAELSKVGQVTKHLEEVMKSGQGTATQELLTEIARLKGELAQAKQEREQFTALMQQVMTNATRIQQELTHSQ